MVTGSKRQRRRRRGRHPGGRRPDAGRRRRGSDSRAPVAVAAPRASGKRIRDAHAPCARDGLAGPQAVPCLRGWRDSPRAVNRLFRICAELCRSCSARAGMRTGSAGCGFDRCFRVLRVERAQGRDAVLEQRLQRSGLCPQVRRERCALELPATHGECGQTEVRRHADEPVQVPALRAGSALAAKSASPARPWLVSMSIIGRTRSPPRRAKWVASSRVSTRASTRASVGAGAGAVVAAQGLRGGCAATRRSRRACRRPYPRLPRGNAPPRRW